MAVGIYGGSFDPIHLGHLITTQSVLEKRNLEKVIYIPSYISPLKQQANALADFHRAEMIKMAIQPFPYFEVSNYEINKKDVSYTVETLQYFSQIYTEIELIIGYDNLLVFEEWKSPDEIFELAKVVVMVRNQNNNNQKENRFFKEAIFIDTPNIEISSSEIRERIKNNKPIDFLVPHAVNEYILQNNLYR